MEGVTLTSAVGAIVAWRFLTILGCAALPVSEIFLNFLPREMSISCARDGADIFDSRTGYITGATKTHSCLVVFTATVTGTNRG